MTIPMIQGQPLVRRKSMPATHWYWERQPITPANVYIIPVIDGIPVVHKFEIVPMSDIFRGMTEDEERASKAVYPHAAE